MTAGFNKKFKPVVVPAVVVMADPPSVADKVNVVVPFVEMM